MVGIPIMAIALLPSEFNYDEKSIYSTKYSIFNHLIKGKLNPLPSLRDGTTAPPNCKPSPQNWSTMRLAYAIIAGMAQAGQWEQSMCRGGRKRIARPNACHFSRDIQNLRRAKEKLF